MDFCPFFISMIQVLTTATKTLLRVNTRLKFTDHLFISCGKKDGWFVGELVCLRDGEPAYWPGVSGAAKEIIGRMPELKYDKIHGTYVFSATDFNVLLLHHCWPIAQLHFRKRPGAEEDEIARMTFEMLLLRFVSQTERANMQARFKLEDELPELPVDWLVHKERPLSDYQTAGCLFGLGTSGSGLFMDRGTGKTAVAIQRVCMEAERKQDFTRVLIVVPKQVRENWRREFERFATVPGKAVVSKGTQPDRVKATVQGIKAEEGLKFGVVLVSIDSLANDLHFMKQIPWDGIIVDESQKFKDPSRKRWKTLRDLRGSAQWRTILSGSPIGNSPMDLWTQLEFLDEGMSGFREFRYFRKFYGVWEDVQGTPGVQSLVGLKNMPLLQERLARCTFQVTKEDAKLGLPDKTYDLREVEMTKKQTDLYNKTAASLAVSIEDKLSGVVDEMTMKSILTQLLRLAQITSGFMTWDGVIDPLTGLTTKERRIEWVSFAKIDAVVGDLKEELAEDPLSKKIVWASEVPSLRILQEKMIDAGIGCRLYYGSTPDKQRQKLVDDFNRDKYCRVFIGNQQCAGEGLDLLGYDKEDQENSQTYCDHEVFFSQNWSSLLRAQAEDRAHRRGTRVPVRITDYAVLGTIDEELRARVTAKIQMANDITNVRSVLKAVLGGSY